MSVCLPSADDVGQRVVDSRPTEDDDARVEQLAGLLEAHSEAFAACMDSITVLIDAGVLLVPADEFRMDEAESLYRYTFSDDSEPVATPVYLDDMGCYALFACRGDVDEVVRRHVAKPVYMPAIVPVWEAVMRIDGTEARPTLYAYGEGEGLHIFAFNGRRMKFANRFKASHPHDMLYYILFVWEQLGMRPEKDALQLLGQTADDEWLRERLEQFVLHVGTDASQRLDNDVIYG